MDQNVVNNQRRDDFCCATCSLVKVRLRQVSATSYTRQPISLSFNIDLDESENSVKDLQMLVGYFPYEYKDKMAFRLTFSFFHKNVPSAGWPEGENQASL